MSRKIIVAALASALLLGCGSPQTSSGGATEPATLPSVGSDISTVENTSSTTVSEQIPSSTQPDAEPISLEQIGSVEILPNGTEVVGDLVVWFRDDGALCVGSAPVVSPDTDTVARRSGCRPGPNPSLDLFTIVGSTRTSESPSPESQMLAVFTSAAIASVAARGTAGDLCAAQAVRFAQYPGIRGFSCAIPTPSDEPVSFDLILTFDDGTNRQLDFPLRTAD